MSLTVGQKVAEKPKVALYCGSSCFVDILKVCAWLIERDGGAITQTLHLSPGWYTANLPSDHVAEHEARVNQESLLRCLATAWPINLGKARKQHFDSNFNRPKENCYRKNQE